MFLLICSTPRVGSNLLQSILYHTGVAGNAKEFFGKQELMALGAQHCGFKSIEEATQNFEHYFQTMQAT